MAGFLTIYTFLWYRGYVFTTLRVISLLRRVRVEIFSVSLKGKNDSLDRIN